MKTKNSFFLAAASVGSVLMTATGGTVTTVGDYKIHTFLSSGTFQVTSGSGNVWSLVIAGGGGGGISGGGGGGMLDSSAYDHAVSVGSYTVTVGTGGAPGVSGVNSVFDTITSIGGGGGGGGDGSNGLPGGSGGGAGVFPGDSDNYIPGFVGSYGSGTGGQGYHGGNAWT